MEFYTFDSVNLVLADMTGTLGLSADEASWLLTVYSCSLFFGVPISIWLAGHVGYKRFLIATTILFAIASMGCAVSSTLEAFLPGVRSRDLPVRDSSSGGVQACIC